MIRKRSLAGLLACSTVILAVGGVAMAAQRVGRFSMESASMAPTLEKGDVVLTALIDSPRRGDVLVFMTPGRKPAPYIKRLIAVGGDRVQMVGGVVMLNGAPQTSVNEGVGEPNVCWNGARAQRLRETNSDGRSYLIYDCGPRGDMDDTSVVVVPAGHFFFLGDNRDNSLDSRVEPAGGGLGFVPEVNLIGKAKTVFLSRKRRVAGAPSSLPVE